MASNFEFMAQDVIRCKVCAKCVVEFTCSKCRVDLCEGCVTKHISSDPSMKHQVVGYLFTTVRNPSTKSNPEKTSGLLQERLSIQCRNDDCKEIKTLPPSQLLEKPKKQKTFKTDCHFMDKVTSASNGDLLVSGNEDLKIMRYNVRGTLSMTHKANSQSGRLFTFSVTSEDDMVYSDGYTVMKVNHQTGISETVITRQQGWEIQVICLSSSGDIIVFMVYRERPQNHKISRFSVPDLKEDILLHDQGQTLSVSVQHKHRLEENGTDICFLNCSLKTVVVMDKEGQVKFRSAGNFPSKKSTTFSPWDIATDRMCHILVLDRHPNNSIHILDQSGQFLIYINNCDLKRPSCMCVNSQGLLCVGELDTQKMKIIEYLK